MRGCALQQTIARRNSSLGRVAPPSQRLLLELEFLEHAPPCIALQRERNNQDLAGLLQRAYRQKQEQLPARVFNATLASAEYRDFWRAPTALGAYPEDTSSTIITALEEINRDVRRWLGSDYGADGERFEFALGAVSTGDGGELLSALRLQAVSLAALNDAIDRRLLRGDLCTAGRLPDAAPILRTVVQKFFVGDVQPWSASLNQRYHALIGPIQALERALAGVLPPAYEDWRSERDASLARSLDAPSVHVRRLQALLGPCYPEFSREPTAGPE